MAVASTTLIQEISATDATSYTTASFTITSGRPVLIGVITAEATVSTIPTIAASGHGSTHTWAQESTQETDGGTTRRRETVFSALPTSTGADTITIDCGANTQLAFSVHVIEFTGANTSDIVRQAVTNRGSATGTVTVTLAALTAGNATIGFFVINGSTALVAGSGFTDIANNSDTTADAPTRHMTEFLATDDTTVDASISGATARRWVGTALELNAAAAANEITAVPAEATADGIVPVLGVTLVAPLAAATAEGIVASLPAAALVPTGILGDTDITGIAVLGNFTPGSSGGPSAVIMPSAVASATASAVAPTLDVAVLGTAAAAVAVAQDDDMDPPFLVVELETFAVASAAAAALVPVPVAELVSATAEATAEGVAATLTSSADFIAIAAGAIASAPVPVLGVTLTGTIALATAEGIAVTFDAELLGVTAAAGAEAPVPMVAELETVVAGDLALSIIESERLSLAMVETEALSLGAVTRERLALEVEAL